MPLPTDILYPVDFSERSRLVWPAVASMARQLGVPVTLFHVMGFDHIPLPQFYKALREFAQEQLDQFPIRDGDAPCVLRELAEGPAAQCIVERARRMERPLIMMPTHGYTRFRQLLLGSVTASVLHDANCPVWTEAHREGHPDHTGVIKAMVCAIDMGPQTPGVLLAAWEFSRYLGATLQVIHSVPGIDPRFSSGLAERAHGFLVDQALEDFPAHCRKACVDLPLEIVEDVGLTDGILAAATRHHADLLVIGRGVMQGPLGRLRTNAHQLIRHSPCAVLSV
jgi:nucleotide-binding universal stress UspA family protein